MDFFRATWFDSSSLLVTGASLAIILGANSLFQIRFSKDVIINYLVCVLTGPMMLSTRFQVTRESWSNFPLFILLVDIAYYGVHRFFHGFKIHWKHHKPPDNPLQCLDFHPLEFFPSYLIFFATSRIFAIPVAAFEMFLIFYFMLQMVLHSGKDYQWPILMSPVDHSIHHTRHLCNFSQIFKLPDRLFGTYYVPPGVIRQ